MHHLLPVRLPLRHPRAPAWGRPGAIRCRRAFNSPEMIQPNTPLNAVPLGCVRPARKSWPSMPMVHRFALTTHSRGTIRCRPPASSQHNGFKNPWGCRPSHSARGSFFTVRSRCDAQQCQSRVSATRVSASSLVVAVGCHQPVGPAVGAGGPCEGTRPAGRTLVLLCTGQTPAESELPDNLLRKNGKHGRLKVAVALVLYV